MRATESMTGAITPDGRIGRRHRDQKRAEAHDHDRQRQGPPPAVAVGQIAEKQAADRPHEEGYGKERRGGQLLRHRIGLGEERAGEIERESRIGIDVIPFDEVAHRTGQDLPHLASGLVGCGDIPPCPMHGSVHRRNLPIFSSGLRRSGFRRSGFQLARSGTRRPQREKLTSGQLEVDDDHPVNPTFAAATSLAPAA